MLLSNSLRQLYSHDLLNNPHRASYSCVSPVWWQWVKMCLWCICVVSQPFHLLLLVSHAVCENNTKPFAIYVHQVYNRTAPWNFPAKQRAEFQWCVKGQMIHWWRINSGLLLGIWQLLDIQFNAFFGLVNNADGDDYIFMIVLFMQICPA